jgi:hypothetical protein
MPRRAATFTQADVARAIRAAKQAGAEAVEMRPDGSIVVLLKCLPVASEHGQIPVHNGQISHDIIL